jgi:hypothetical protein
LTGQTMCLPLETTTSATTRTPSSPHLLRCICLLLGTFTR